jgi:hypothetical protein
MTTGLCWILCAPDSIHRNALAATAQPSLLEKYLEMFSAHLPN